MHKLTEEHPPPSGMAESALHVTQHTSSDEGSEGVGNKVTTKENSVSKGEFPASVPLQILSVVSSIFDSLG